MVSPNSLLTNQVGSNYDDKGSQVVSPEVADIKPVYGIVDQESEEKEATIGVQVRNNYGSTISDIQILGKIPFEGNTYVISWGDLGSTFTTKMTNAGITVPEELQQYATVYYSENENTDRDLSKAENGWKTAEEVTDKTGILNEKEATITNTMVKIPSTVIVKYVDKNTGEEISDEKEKEGIIGDPFLSLIHIWRCRR